MKSLAPRAFNREMYHDHPENVFYGTDDGDQDGSFSEFAAFRATTMACLRRGAKGSTWSAWWGGCTA